MSCFRTTVGVCYKKNLSPRQRHYLLSISNQFEELISWHQVKPPLLPCFNDNVTLHLTRGKKGDFHRCVFKRDKEKKWHVWLTRMESSSYWHSDIFLVSLLLPLLSAYFLFAPLVYWNHRNRLHKHQKISKKEIEWRE